MTRDIDGDAADVGGDDADVGGDDADVGGELHLTLDESQMEYIDLEDAQRTPQEKEAAGELKAETLDTSVSDAAFAAQIADAQARYVQGQTAQTADYLAPAIDATLKGVVEK